MDARSILLCALALPACTSTYPQSTVTVSSAAMEKVVGRAEAAAAVVHSLRDHVPANVLLAARCVVVIPQMVSGGFVVGAEHGRGYASCRAPDGWSAPVPVTVSGGTFGAQIGVESLDVLMLVMTDEAKHGLLGSKLELGGDVSAAAGPVGTGQGADWNGRTAVLTYSRASGLYAGADLGGVVVHADTDGVLVLYGPNASVAAVLDGRVPATAPTAPLLEAIGSTLR